MNQGTRNMVRAVFRSRSFFSFLQSISKRSFRQSTYEFSRRDFVALVGELGAYPQPASVSALSACLRLSNTSFRNIVPL